MLPDPIGVFTPVRTLSMELQGYNPRNIPLSHLAYLLRSAADAANLSTFFYQDVPDADAYYHVWLAAMNRNFGNCEYQEPFDGVLLDANEGYLREFLAAVDKYINAEGHDAETNRKYGVPIGMMMGGPVSILQATDACFTVSMNMQDAKVTDDLIPSQMGMAKALYYDGLYGPDFFKHMAVGLEKLRDADEVKYNYVRNVYFEIPGPHVDYEWYLPEEMGIPKLRVELMRK